MWIRRQSRVTSEQYRRLKTPTPQGHFQRHTGLCGGRVPRQGSHHHDDVGTSPPGGEAITMTTLRGSADVPSLSPLPPAGPRVLPGSPQQDRRVRLRAPHGRTGSRGEGGVLSPFSVPRPPSRPRAAVAHTRQAPRSLLRTATLLATNPSRPEHKPPG